MIPTSFADSNDFLNAPPGRENDIGPLCISHCVAPNGETVIVSCWKMTKEEIVEFARTGRIYLQVLHPTMPAVKLSPICPIVQNTSET